MTENSEHLSLYHQEILFWLIETSILLILLVCAQPLLRFLHTLKENLTSVTLKLNRPDVLKMCEYT